MAGKPSLFTHDRVQFVRINAARGMFIRNIVLAFNKRFKTNITVVQIRNLCTSKRIKYRAFVGGTRTGIANGGGRIEIGAERVKTDVSTGYKYTYVKVSHKGSWLKMSGTWIPKHRLVWEQSHGKIPKNHVVIFADGNRQNFSIDNLLLLSKSEHMIMSVQGLITTDSELTKVGKGIAGIKIAISKRIKKEAI